MSSYGSDTLKTIENGKVPQTRMRSADTVQNFVRRLVDNDERRAFKRSRVNGLVDGNPPYRLSKLKEAGRADACNVNWGIARAYMESGVGAFYDLFSEAPGFFSITTSHGDDEHRDEYCRIMSEEADKVLVNDNVVDYNMQRSQDQMVLHGCGPLMFENGQDVLPRAVNTGDLKVPEFTKSDTHYWETCMVQIDYYPPELYAYIKNEQAASAVGWDVEYTKNVIQNAMDVKTQPGIRYEWEFYQQELKNNSLAYFDDSKINRLAHVFWKEFNGRITHVIVERDNTTSTPTNAQTDNAPNPGIKFLFRSVGRYSSWRECVHPMYFDRGNGGYHHSVTGLGVKMYAAMEYQNRLLCNISDKAFSPKTLFKPTSAEASQRFQLAHHGDYALLPPGYDAVQNPIAGMLNEGLAWNNELTGLMQSNLSQYRQQSPMKQEGNPVTAKQVMYDASQSASVSKTTYNRYYKQLDLLYTEIVRRLCNLNSTDERAKDYQKRCLDKGVPRECFGRVESVTAVRVIGQGSTFMRKQAVDGLAAIVGALPEDGRNNWLCDKIAVEAGQSAVNRYNPQKSVKPKMASDQQAEATLQIAAMKIGVPPIVTSSQNPLTFAAAFLAAGVQAVQSVQQGGNPLEVLKFMDLDGPAIAAHLKRFANDPLRAGAWKQLTEQWKQLSQVVDQLKQIVQQGMEKQRQQQTKTATTMNDLQIANAKAKNDIQIKQVKTQQQLQIQREKHQLNVAKTAQDLQLKDAVTAAEIHRNRMKSTSEE